MSDSVTRRLLKAEAQRRGWAVETIGRDDYFLKVTLPDGRSELFRGSRPSRSSANGFVVSKYKDLTVQFAEGLGYKMPAFTLLEQIEQPAEFMHEYGVIVVKPADGGKSEGVTVGVDTGEKLTKAIAYAKQFSLSGKVLLQQQLEGKLYRLTVINGKFVAGAQRRAPQVNGNGQQTVRELIEELNRDPRRGKGSDTPLKKVSLELAEEYLGADEMQRRPDAGETVRVSALDSVSAGGEAINVTESVHDDWRRFCSLITQESGQFIAGFDVMCDDIALPLEGYYVPMLEMNSSPGFKLHQYPTGGGEPVELAPILFDELFIC